MEKRPALSNPGTLPKPEIISIDEADPVKQQELINSTLTTITIREYAKYERRSKADGDSNPCYQKDIIFLLRSIDRLQPQRRTYRIHIDADGMTVLIQQAPGEARTSPARQFRAGSKSVSLPLCDGPLFEPDTASCIPACEPTAAVYSCSQPAKQSKTTIESPGARVIPLPLKKQLSVSYVPSLPGEAGYRPQFRFGGLYLEKFGFFYGTKVSMQVEQNKITLTVDEPKFPDTPNE
jgi:hypothetical protein